jgi:hypothetical protein
MTATDWNKMHLIRFCYESGLRYDKAQVYISFVREVFEKCMILSDEGELPSSVDAISYFYDLMVRKPTD